ncbi:unnamed protein product [Cylindrotheca closterium]|uniref:Uncharacterized protein n=1 Tax=Cylindrotheca closterium TaxID=2856 RepID=A0AAD2PUF9_9STRA|nr:unnamed protein product [Cylindrotheca closterium]
MAQRDYSIEFDFSHKDFEKALDEGRSLDSLCITEEFLDTQNTRPTEKRLEAILSKISEMWSLQGVYLSLQKTAIPGRLLPLAINPGLQELKVHSGLEINSLQDCDILAATLKQNGLSLKRISLLNIRVRLNAMASLGRFALGSQKPILDPLLEAVPDLEFLETFEISCRDSEQNTKGKPLISTDSLRSLCQSLSLKRFNLSNLGLGDEHFMAIAQELSKKPPTLQELILNENFNTELGVEMIIRMLLDTPNTTIRTFQAFQKTSQLSPACISLMRHVLEKHNTTLTSISISTSTDQEMDTLQYFEQLNSAGRHLFLQKHSTADDWIRLLESVNDDHSMIFYCLRQSKFWWNCIDLGRSLSRPLMKSKTLDTDTGEEQSDNEVKVVVGESDDENSEELMEQLKSLGMSNELELDYSDHETNVSSQASDSYLDDLHRQKDTLIDSTREEALEEAHDIYEKKFGKDSAKEDEKAFLELFYKILKEKEQQMDKMYEKQDELIAKETERQRQKSEAEKEAWMLEKEAARRRRRELAQEAKEKERQDKLTAASKAASSRKLSSSPAKKKKPKKKVAAEKLKRTQTEADELREKWNKARSKTRAAKKKNPESYDKLKGEEDSLFNDWVAKKAEVKEAEIEAQKEAEESQEEVNPEDGAFGSVEDVWAALSELEEEAAQIARDG